MRAGGGRGFTLLELMIGLALLGLIMTVLFAGLRLALDGRDAAEAASEQANRIRLVQALLARELAAVYPYRWKNTADTNLAFLGKAERLRFVSSTPPRAGPGGLNLVELQLDGGNDGVTLLMRRRILDHEQRDFDLLQDAESTVLLDHLESAALDYFGADTPSGKLTWRDKWEDPQRLPRLVRLRLRSKGAPAWPDVVAAPHVSENAGCAGWDAVNEICHGLKPP